MRKNNRNLVRFSSVALVILASGVGHIHEASADGGGFTTQPRIVKQLADGGFTTQPRATDQLADNGFPTQPRATDQLADNGFPTQQRTMAV